MNRPDPEPAPTPAETALDEVLAAERQAREAVAECRTRGEAIRDLGRARAQHIRARAEERIVALHARSDATVARTVAVIAEEARSLAGPVEPDDAQIARLDLAIATLAAELTGGAP
jgi:vacuolar-type H+-ATPase subunit H